MGAEAQNTSKRLPVDSDDAAQRRETASAVTDCPRSPQELAVQTLYGHWRVRFEGQPEATMELRAHPEYTGVRGTLTRGGMAAQLAGDIDDEGVLALDESENGRSISAVWALELQPDSCGKEFKGTWQYAGDEGKVPVMLTKIAPAR